MAALFHRSTFDAILAWASHPDHASKPFGAVYAYLAELGYVVRVSGMPLVAMKGADGSQGGGQEKTAFCSTHDQMMHYFANHGSK